MSSAAATATTTAPSTVVATENGYRLPDNATLQHASKLAITEDKPIMMDYWKNSIDKTVMIGVKSDNSKERILVRSEEEYTSPISKVYKSGNDYIVVTENSIYVVDVNIPTRKITV